MNDTVKDFLNRFNIDAQKISSMPEAQIKSGLDVNRFVDRNLFTKPQPKKMVVSIADIVGYNSSNGSDEDNVIDRLSSFFDREGDSYYRRSVSMLEIPPERLMEELEYSFKHTPMNLQEIDRGVYNIGCDGMHRFHVIKTHYLNELSKLDPQDYSAVEELNQKYSFSAEVSQIDFVKTYSSFLLRSMNRLTTIENEFNDNYELTDSVRISLNNETDDQFVLTDDELLEYVGQQMKGFLKNGSEEDIEEFNRQKNAAYTNFPSFKNFYDENLSPILQREAQSEDYSE